MKPDDHIAGAKASHQSLLTSLAGLTDRQARRPSRLPDWSVGHVLTHLARNAEGICNMFAGAAVGEVWEMYPGGFERRARDIEAGAGRRARELSADVAETLGRLETHWDNATDDMWVRGRGRRPADELPLHDLVFRRWRETEIHHHDLGLSYRYTDWPDAYVMTELSRTIADLGTRLEETGIALRSTDSQHVWTVPESSCSVVEVRAPRRQLLAWLVGRYEEPYYPILKPW